MEIKDHDAWADCEEILAMARACVRASSQRMARTEALGEDDVVHEIWLRVASYDRLESDSSLHEFVNLAAIEVLYEDQDFETNLSDPWTQIEGMEGLIVNAQDS